MDETTGVGITKPFLYAWSNRGYEDVLATYDPANDNMSGDVWVYWKVPTVSFEFADDETIERGGAALENLMANLGALMVAPLGNNRLLQTVLGRRRIHVMRVTAEIPPKPHETDTPRFARFFNQTYGKTVVPHQFTFIGITLTLSLARQSFFDRLTNSTDIAPDPELWSDDYERVTAALRAAGCEPATADEMRWLTDWDSFGEPKDLYFEEEADSFVHSADGITPRWSLQFAALYETRQRVFDNSRDLWAADLRRHPQRPDVLSIRAELEHPSVTRNRFRRARSKIEGEIDEEEKAADRGGEREEVFEDADMARSGEDLYRGKDALPHLTNVSVVAGRRVFPGDEERADQSTYIDYLAEQGLGMNPLVHRQMVGYLECLPGGSTSLGSQKPFGREWTVGMLSGSGILAANTLGDDRGPVIGREMLDHGLVRLNPEAANTTDAASPGMAVLGDSGSGKTVFLQYLAGQMVDNGKPVFFINLKPSQPLAGLTEFHSAEKMSLGRLDDEAGGGLDFCRIFPPRQGGLGGDDWIGDRTEAVMAFLGSVYSTEELWTTKVDGLVRRALRQGFAAGARTTGEALIDHVPIVLGSELGNEVLETIFSQDDNPLFRLFVGRKPEADDEVKPPFGKFTGMIVVEPDSDMEMPSSTTPLAELSPTQRILLAGLRSLNRAILGLLVASGGGGMVIDEAHVVLNHADTRAWLITQAKVFRSLGILPIYATQQPTEIFGADLSSYITRWVTLHLKTKEEQQAALAMMGVPDTEENRGFLLDAKPVPKRGLPARALHRDIRGRTGRMTVEIPQDRLAHYTTQAEDVARSRHTGGRPPTSPQTSDPTASPEPQG